MSEKLSVVSSQPDPRESSKYEQQHSFLHTFLHTPLSVIGWRLYPGTEGIISLKFLDNTVNQLEDACPNLLKGI